MSSGHRDDGSLAPDKANHPGRKVASYSDNVTSSEAPVDTHQSGVRAQQHNSWAAAREARTREYDAVRSGKMSPEDAARVGINHKATMSWYDKRKPS